MLLERGGTGRFGGSGTQHHLAEDFPLAQGAILILAVGFMVVNLVVDVLYAYLDPRIARS